MFRGESTPPHPPRLCQITRSPDFNGYGFNLHTIKNKSGQFIGQVDDGSPAQKALLKEGDRIVEVNGVNIASENHKQVVHTSFCCTFCISSSSSSSSCSNNSSSSCSNNSSSCVEATDVYTL
ncbi:PDZ domain [Trinorchestia longiramus]|nr:PDZ domain [Trinorchestia longiramus]